MDILAEGRALAEKQFAEGGFQGKKNAYECETCGSFIVTIDRDPGVTPFMTKCGNCGGFAQSKFYHVQDWLDPTFEWYRPRSLYGIDARNFDHLRKGGLLLRPIARKPDRWTRPSDIKSVAAGQRVDDWIREMRDAERNASMVPEMTPQPMSRQVRRRLSRKGRA